jgi:NTE family protein
VNINGVFCGGGIKAIALLGALEEVEKQGYKFNKVAGTSAGAILASLIIAGYTVDEIKKLLLETKFNKLLDTRKSIFSYSVLKWISIYWRLGLYRGDALEKWLEKILAKKGIKTFADIKQGKLRIIASDLSKGRIMVLPDDLKDYGFAPERFSVARAVRMSSSLPYFFEPIKLQTSGGEKRVIVDGGVLSNFPMWLFEEQNGERYPTIGFRLSPSMENVASRQIKNAFEMYGALFDTMKDAHDARHIATSHEKNIIFIPVKDVVTTEFNITNEQKEKLLQLGKKCAEKFFKRWIY